MPFFCLKNAGIRGLVPSIMSNFAPEFQNMEDSTKHIHISDYDYNLPEERIAKHPKAVRDHSKLLVYDKGKISHTLFSDVTSFLSEDSLIIFNNTKVIQARLHFRKETGALIEIFCLEPWQPKSYECIFSQKERCEWLCLIGNRKKWKEGILSRKLTADGKSLTLSAERVGVSDNSDIIRFSWDDENVTFSEILSLVGELPIPPYLNRATEESDKRDYQTVYSKIDGSVAAPTAGLHFTEHVLAQIDARHIERNEITLHVGAGTFKPVKTESIEDHEMHSEYIFVPWQTIDALMRHNGECTCVGTTSVRTIESLYYIGLNIINHPDISEEGLKVEQWQPYAGTASVSEMDALKAIRDYMVRHQLQALHTSTQIIIAPGYRYHFVKRLITNFHMPKSTLLLLVSAFIGEDWRKVYQYALDNDFRFLSYGDSSILIP